MMSFGDVFMTYDEVILQRFILCGKVEKNSCFLPLNNERTPACYKLIIKTMRKLKMWKSLVVIDTRRAEEQPGLQSSLRPNKSGFD